jgi:lipopolysaccharide export system permease protein
MSVNLNFFPSRGIAFYMARLFLTRSLAVLAMLVLVLLTLDLLGNSSKILAHAGNGDPELFRYAGLRIPQLISRFLPFSALLGTLIALVSLNQHSEIVTMKAAGISAHQIIAPLIAAGLALSLLLFVFNERIVARANASLSAWEAVDYGPVPPETGTQENVQVQHGEDLIFVRALAGGEDRLRLSGLTLYDRAGGRLRRVIEARRGQWTGEGWRLENVSIFNVDTGQRLNTARAMLGPELRPEQVTLAAVDAEERGFTGLARAILALNAAGRQTGALEAQLWHKLSGPLSTVLMPLLAAVAAFGLARSGHLFVRAVIGMFLGFGYFVADNFALAMGNFGAYPPFLAAWGPFLLFLMIGEAVLIRTEE